ncbi:MAG: hypothetical protein GPI92_17880 [Microcystis aeruginosa K13-06]|nr:hypothetical protein [Microcystis aeruginosa K13-06]
MATFIKNETIMRLSNFSLLAITGFILGTSVFMNPAFASEPVILETGKSTTFPTWEAGKTTKLCVSAIGGNAQVKINAGAAQESLSVASGQTKCIDRSWGGIYIGVTNQGLNLAKVWTS